MNTPENHVVLARKWRPRTFEEVVGQDHVVRALTYALDHQMIHHAYLLTGTRGVGKTSVARLIAQSLNCLEGVSSTPCGVCSSCEAVRRGQAVDCVELDAALHTRVDDMRELLDNALYPPVQCRYKVYVIDEVHMLSASAFQALLKTLEEPPAYLQFILATTDPQKIPPAVLSRCLQFGLRLLPDELLCTHLSHVMTQEGIGYEPTALLPIARAASGSIRDALSLLDQVRAYGQGAVRLVDVQYLLGIVSEEVLIAILTQVVVDGDLPAARSQAHTLLGTCQDVDVLLSGMLHIWHQCMLVEADLLAVHSAELAALVRAVSGEQIQMLYQITAQSRKQRMLAPHAAVALDVCLIRLHAYSCVQPQVSPFSPVSASLPPPVRAAASEKMPPPPSPPVSMTPMMSSTAVPDSPAAWQALVAQLSLTAGIKRLADSLVWTGLSLPHDIHVQIDQPSHALLESFVAPLSRALSHHCGVDVHLVIQLIAADMPLVGSTVQQEKVARDQQRVAAQQRFSQDTACQQLCTLFGVSPDWQTLSDDACSASSEIR